MKKKTDQPLMNEDIRSFKIRVISDNGDNLGVLTRSAALGLAKEKELDLVVLSETDGIPLAKIMDYGKSLYVKKKKMSEGRKKQKVVKVKEIKLRPKIGIHDFMTKINQGVKFLSAGNKLKVTLMFRGRGMETRRVVGAEFFQKIHEALLEKVSSDIVKERDMIVGQFWSRVYYLKSS